MNPHQEVFECSQNSDIGKVLKIHNFRLLLNPL